MGNENIQFESLIKIRQEADALEELLILWDAQIKDLQHQLEDLNKRHEKLTKWANRVVELTSIDDYSNMEALGRVIVVQAHISEAALKISVDKGMLVRQVFERLREQMNILVREGRFG